MAHHTLTVKASRFRSVALSPPQKHCKKQPGRYPDQNISNIANKLQVADRAQAIGKARQSGLGD